MRVAYCVVSGDRKEPELSRTSSRETELSSGLEKLSHGRRKRIAPGSSKLTSLDMLDQRHTAMVRLS